LWGFVSCFAFKIIDIFYDFIPILSMGYPPKKFKQNNAHAHMSVWPVVEGAPQFLIFPERIILCFFLKYL